MIDKKYSAGNIILFIILMIGGLLILFPIFWMLSTALKSLPEIAQYPPKIFPEKALWGNFKIAWTKAPFTRYLLNTLLVVFFSVIGSVLSNSFIAYGFAKIDFKGRKTLFRLVLATMMIPGFVTLIPQYVLFSKIGWVDSYLPLIVPLFCGNAFHIFMMRQFYMTIPDDLIQAGQIDGASHFYIWAKLIMPMVKPVLASVALFSFKSAWGDFQGPLLYLSTRTKYTFQLGLQVFKGQGYTEWNYLMAVSLLSMIPSLTLFFLFQNYFIQGVNTSGAIKA